MNDTGYFDIHTRHEKMADEKKKSGIEFLYLFEHEPTGRVLVDKAMRPGCVELSLQLHTNLKSSDWSLVYAFDKERADSWLNWLKTEGHLGSTLETKPIDSELDALRVIELVTVMS